jgi:NAD(P)-dependent dehydrogenase (short-subunit alcohol dehydrogenase family)
MAKKNTWTVAQMPRLDGRRAVVTGANSGIGYPAALELARHGAAVVVASRSPEKGLAAVERIRHEAPGAQVEFRELDLASLASVRAFAARELEEAGRLDLLINNAGVMTPPKRLATVEGFELQFGTNVLGHFALTGLLLPAMERAATGDADGPRIVTVASIAHKQGTIHFDDLQFHGGYSPMEAYRQSKLANLMFAMELEKRLRARGSQIMSLAVHPGVAQTNLFQAGQYGAVEKTLRSLMGHVFGTLLNSDVEGALPTLYAATAPDAKGGAYYGPQGLGETRGGDVGPAKVAEQAKDETAAKRLWQICEDLTGVEF